MTPTSAYIYRYIYRARASGRQDRWVKEVGRCTLLSSSVTLYSALDAIPRVPESTGPRRGLDYTPVVVLINDPDRLVTAPRRIA